MKISLSKIHAFNLPVSKFYLLILLILSIFLHSCNITWLSSRYSLSEKYKIIHCNTARFNLVMGARSKEIIRLSNLARTNPELLRKYVLIKYGNEYANRSGIKVSLNKKKELPLLKPSYLLWLSAKFHAIASGLTAYEGHRGFKLRTRLFCNFNCMLPYVMSGENCAYGPYKAIDLFLGWMESSGHRANIMNKNYYRIGIGGFIHFSEYRYNMVQNFSGPKIKDVLFRPNKVFKIKN